MTEAGLDRLRRDIEIDARNAINLAIWNHRLLYEPWPRDLRPPKVIAATLGARLMAQSRLACWRACQPFT